MKVLSLLPLLLFTACPSSFAQYYTNQKKVWVFGKNAGLDFNSWHPTSFTSAMNTSEGVASVSNMAGQLLFYTDGKHVYDRSHDTMPNGGNIVSFSTSSSTQAALIVPVIANPNQYYVFSMQSLGGGNGSQMTYCIVDALLEGGYGDVIASSKGTVIEDSLGEKMIAVTGNNHNIWLLTHLKDEPIFLAYEITIAGINTTPVVSITGAFSGDACYALGVLKVSLNRQKIVSQSYKVSPTTQGGTEVYNFDPNSGIVSGSILLDTSSQYGAEFSPDNTKLYVQQSIEPLKMKIYQYDISLPTTNDIKVSKIEIATVNGTNGSDLKLAPNHKIYFHGETSEFGIYSEYLDCINTPNLAGAACNYVPHAIHLNASTGIGYGLPNLYVTADTLAWTEVTTVNITPDISLFPNPTSKNIVISSSADIEQVTITNISGQQVHTQAGKSKTVPINISNLPTGLYIVNINGTVTCSFVKR